MEEQESEARRDQEKSPVLPERASGRWRQWVYLAIVVLVVLILLVFNLRLRRSANLASSFDECPPIVLAQLRALKPVIQAGAPEKMQKYFPEGFYFTYVFYGLTWVEAALRDRTLKTEALAEARSAYEMLSSPGGVAVFTKELSPPYGMFYASWRADLLAGILLLQTPEKRPAEELEEFEKQCRDVADALALSITPYPPSYVGMAWPCDSLPGLHALRMHEAITGKPTYRENIVRWRERIRQVFDDSVGMFPCYTDPFTGEIRQGARATSQAVILRFLADVDPQFARDQYRKFNDTFYAPLLGLPACREYPAGVAGVGDVDSGPLVIGRSFVPTVISIGVHQIYGDQSLAEALDTAGEAVAFPYNDQNGRRYLFGSLPVGELIVAHARTALPWLSSTREQLGATSVSRLSPNWRLPVHLLSLGFVVLLCAPWMKLLLRRVRPAPLRGK